MAVLTLQLTVFILAGDRPGDLRGGTVDAGGVLGNDTVIEGLPLSQVGDGEVVLADGGVVALEPAVVVPLVLAVDLPLHHVAHDPAAAVVLRHGPAQGHGGPGDVCHLWFTGRIWPGEG